MKPTFQGFAQKGVTCLLVRTPFCLLNHVLWLHGQPRHHKCQADEAERGDVR